MIVAMKAYNEQNKPADINEPTPQEIEQQKALVKLMEERANG